MSAFGSSQRDIHFTFDTVLSWGETANGTWTLRAFDNAAGLAGKLDDWQITLIGKAATRDDVYVYTNEYPDISGANASRGVLVDLDGGNNTINAAALGLDNRIDLSGRTISVLNGANLTIAAGTLIRSVVGGDGNDTLIASDRGSELRGMRGNDTLVGGASLDFALFRGNRADARITKNQSGWKIVTALDGTDTLIAIERVAFPDLSVALDIDGNGGLVARVLGAVFGNPSLTNKTYVGIGLYYLDTGLSYESLMSLALDARLGTGYSNSALVSLLYTNVVGVAPTPADVSTFTGLIDAGSFTRVGLALFAANTDLNASGIGLVGISESGLEYVQFLPT